jgi:hypothetical protein
VTAPKKKISYSETFRAVVPVRKDRKHGWKQHATCNSFLYQVLGRWQCLANLNDGFVYERTAVTAKHIRRYGSPDAPSARTVRRIKEHARALGIIGDDVTGKSQFGYDVRGFYMAKHDDCCHVVGGQHVFVRPILDGYGKSTEILPEYAEKGDQCPGGVQAVSTEIAQNVLSGVPLSVPFGVLAPTAQADVESADAESAAENGMPFGIPVGSAVGCSYPYEPYELKTTHDTEDLAENGSVVQRADGFSQNPMAGKYDSAPGSPRNPDIDDLPPSKKKPEDVLLAAARALARTHGRIGIGLAAAIAATCLNNPDGDGELPLGTRYYTKTAEDKYMRDEDIPHDGALDGFYYEGIAEEGIERLRRAADRCGLNLGRVLYRLENMRSELARRDDVTRSLDPAVIGAGLLR